MIEIKLINWGWPYKREVDKLKNNPNLQSLDIRTWMGSQWGAARETWKKYHDRD